MTNKWIVQWIDDEHDDVQNVYSNFEASDEIMASLDV